jgi:transposase-like protein
MQHTEPQRMEIVKVHLDSDLTRQETANNNNISVCTLANWTTRFKELNPNVVIKARHKSRNTHHSDDFKLEAVRRINAGETQLAVAKDMGFNPANSHNWVNRYAQKVEQEIFDELLPEIREIRQKAFAKLEVEYKAALKVLKKAESALQLITTKMTIIGSNPTGV